MSKKQPYILTILLSFVLLAAPFKSLGETTEGENSATVQASISGCPILPNNNIWNTPVDTLPVDSNSNLYIDTIGANTSVHADFGSGLWDGGPIGIPYTTVPGTQEKVNVSFLYDDESDPGPYPIPADAPIEGGSSSDGDRHVLVIDRDNCILYELYRAFPQPDGSWEADSGAIYHLNSNDLRPAGWTSADAAGLPILPGLVRYDEVASGEIDHAIRFTVPQTRRAYVWPARHYASSLTGTQYPPMGQRFRLKASFDISGYSSQVQVILRAFKKFGIILADNGSAWYISGVPDERWDNDMLHQLDNVRGSDFEAVDVSSLMISPNSGAALQGTANTITVTSPNGGESWNAGTTQAITWTSSGTVGNVMIEYTIDNGSNWNTIAANTANDGAYSWTVPATSSSQCLIKVSESDGSPTDSSDTTFSIVSTTNPKITVTSPNGGESWLMGSTHSITWTSSGTVGNVKIQYTTDNGSSWKTIVSSTINDGSYTWKLPSVTSNSCKVRVSETDGSPGDTSNTVFSIVSTTSKAEISLNRQLLNFGAIIGGSKTGLQTLLIDNSGYGTMDWTITDNADWLTVSPTSGSNSGIITVSINPNNLSAKTYTGTITIDAPNASNTPRTVTVTLVVKNSSQDQLPFGSFETPTNNATVQSSIPVTGWVLDDVQVNSVKIYRRQDNQYIFIGNAVLVEGARPDVEESYPDYPKNYMAGWGYMMLTNFLPNSGNGVFTLYAKATDSGGHEINLGSKTITCANDNAEKPFGAIDTPDQGGAASGSNFINWGWVLTPQPNSIPTNGTTINVYVDGVNLGHPKYGIYRADIASLFPGYANSEGAAGYFNLDTTQYSNGIHTIQWTATDNAGNSDGIGSRYFSIQNSTQDKFYFSQKNEISVKESSRLLSKSLLKSPIISLEPIRIKTGYNDELCESYPGDDGIYTIPIKELDRIEIHLDGYLEESIYYKFPGNWKGNQMIAERFDRLPIGSTLDKEKGIFLWQTGPGYIGNYKLMFTYQTEDGIYAKLMISINILPKY